VVTALYRRYRPETFAELIGQAQVTAPLMTALRSDRVNHAYLFSGPRGCGKTTSARILARCLNCVEGPTDTPCGKCPSCIELSRDGNGSLDVVEIDAASHNGVDDARDLRERAVFAPARDRFKIFILDEAHMVTAAGFNALLKIVEEPPAHVKFIFATTEPDKVISTIRSRTHHYPFRLVAPAQMLDYLEEVCQSEKVKIAPGVLSLVVRSGGGSVRDSLSLLDQLIAGSEGDSVTYERAVTLLGYTPDSLLDSFVDALSKRDSAEAFKAVDAVIQSGQDPRQFVEDILERLRDLMLVNAVGVEAKSILRGVSDELLENMRVQSQRFGPAELTHSATVVRDSLHSMSGATSPKLHLELMVGRALVPAADVSEVGALSRIERLERRIGVGGADGATAPAPAPTKAQSQPIAAAPASTDSLQKPQNQAAAESVPVVQVSKTTAQADVSAIPALTTAQFKDSWNAILSIVEKESKTAWVIAYTLEVIDFEGEVLTLKFASHHDLETFKSSGAAPDVLRRAILTELGVTVKFKPFVPEVTLAAPPPAPVQEPSVQESAQPEVETPALLSEPDAKTTPIQQVEEEVKAKPAKASKSRATDMADSERYGESVVRDLLGGVPIDESGSGY